MKLETKRLILKKPNKKDVKDIIENINNLQVSKYLKVVSFPYTKKDALSFIKMLNQKNNQDFSIELKSENKIIGGIGFSSYNKWAQTANIGYWLGQKYWRQGIISEALIKFIDYGFNKLKLRRIELHAYTPNKASNNVAKKFGFKLEGKTRKSARTKSTGKVHDTNIYGLLKSEWLKKRITFQ